MGFPKRRPLRQEFLWDFDTTNKDADSTAATGTINILSAPADSLITNVAADVITAVTGSTAETVGDGTDVDGYLLDTFAASIQYVPLNNQDSPRGALVLDSNAGVTDALDVTVTAATNHYTSADTIDYIITGTATAGKIRFIVDFMVLS